MLWHGIFKGIFRIFYLFVKGPGRGWKVLENAGRGRIQRKKSRMDGWGKSRQKIENKRKTQLEQKAYDMVEMAGFGGTKDKLKKKKKDGWWPKTMEGST